MKRKKNAAKKKSAAKKRREAKRSSRDREKKRSARASQSGLSAADLVLEAIEHHRAGRLTEAEEGYRKALEKNPDLPDALNLLGMITLDTGDPLVASKLFARAVAVAPHVAQYQLNLGNAFSTAKMLDLAVEALERAAELDPSSVAAHYNLALAHLSRKSTEDAVAAFREVVKLDPTHPRATFLITALSGQHCDTAPVEYIADLFDDYAETFDRHLVENLEYRSPKELRGLVENTVDLREKSWKVLDLGCGTGLCGSLFRDVASWLVGSDVSAGMIEKARERQVYEELHVEDMVDTLKRAHADVDLVLATDVFIYVGNLEPTFSACASALREGGLFGFTTEKHDGDGFRLHRTCRYGHSDGYIRALAEKQGFGVLRANETVLRTHDHEAVSGWVYLLQHGSTKLKDNNRVGRAVIAG